jgi:hypothetical protein
MVCLPNGFNNLINRGYIVSHPVKGGDAIDKARKGEE